MSAGPCGREGRLGPRSQLHGKKEGTETQRDGEQRLGKGHCRTETQTRIRAQRRRERGTGPEREVNQKGTETKRKRLGVGALRHGRGKGF